MIQFEDGGVFITHNNERGPREGCKFDFGEAISFLHHPLVARKRLTNISKCYFSHRSSAQNNYGISVRQIIDAAAGQLHLVFFGNNT